MALREASAPLFAHAVARVFCWRSQLKQRPAPKGSRCLQQTEATARRVLLAATQVLRVVSQDLLEGGLRATAAPAIGNAVAETTAIGAAAAARRNRCERIHAMFPFLHVQSQRARQLLPNGVRHRINRLGRYIWPMFGGVLIIRAIKKLYSPHQQTNPALRHRVRQFIVRQPAGAVSPKNRHE